MLVKAASLAVLAALVAGPALADWEGDLEMKSARMGARHQGPPPSGKLRFHDARLRMDMQMGPMSMVSIVHFKEGKVFLLNEASKSYSETTRESMGPDASLPHCASAHFAECMKQQGMKKVGSEEANGQACSVWEGERKTSRGNVHEKLWHPDAAGDEFALVKSVRTANGHTTETNLLNWKKAPQEASLFEVPEGYTRSQGIPGMMMGPPSMKGFKPKPGGPTGGEVKEKDEE